MNLFIFHSLSQSILMGVSVLLFWSITQVHILHILVYNSATYFKQKIFKLQYFLSYFLSHFLLSQSYEKNCCCCVILQTFSIFLTVRIVRLSDCLFVYLYCLLVYLSIVCLSIYLLPVCLFIYCLLVYLSIQPLSVCHFVCFPIRYYLAPLIWIVCPCFLNENGHITYP